MSVPASTAPRSNTTLASAGGAGSEEQATRERQRSRQRIPGRYAAAHRASQLGHHHVFDAGTQHPVAPAQVRERRIGNHSRRPRARLNRLARPPGDARAVLTGEHHIPTDVDAYVPLPVLHRADDVRTVGGAIHRDQRLGDWWSGDGSEGQRRGCNGRAGSGWRRGLPSRENRRAYHAARHDDCSYDHHGEVHPRCRWLRRALRWVARWPVSLRWRVVHPATLPRLHVAESSLDPPVRLPDTRP